MFCTIYFTIPFAGPTNVDYYTRNIVKPKIVEFAARVVLLFSRVGNLMKSEAWVFEITSPTTKISLNHHLNKFSQFKYYIWDVKMLFYQKNCSSVTIFEYSSTSRCYLAVCQFRVTHCFARQSADLPHLKLTKKGKSVWPVLFWGNMCI